MAAPRRKFDRDRKIIRTMEEHPNWSRTKVAAKFDISVPRLYYITERLKREHNV